ncbi:hypothetical protein GCM10010317_102200 [Streptomyces mirabilis]|nr:hypothetical protein GCM10010317_102200 [Streptomyces mirabilis]
MLLSSHTAWVPAGGGTLWKSQPGGGKGHTDPCRPAPWTLRLQTARLGSIQQVRGMAPSVTAGSALRRPNRCTQVARPAVAGAFGHRGHGPNRRAGAGGLPGGGG